MTPTLSRHALAATLGAPLVLALAARAGAHDFWIEPATFRPPADSPVRIHLRVGDEFPGEAVPRRPERIAQFFVRGPLGEKTAVQALPQAEPAGVVRASGPGVHVLAYVSTGSRSELPAEKFERYLKEEGLEAVSRERAGSGEGDKPGIETYYRSVKSVLFVGEPVAGAEKAVGLPLELVPEQSLAALDGPRKVRFRLLFDGKPVDGARVRARRRGERDAVAENVSARSDRDGRVELELRGDGFWLVTSVHMIRSRDPSKGDWESYWASLTFETASGKGRPEAPPGK